MNGAHYQPRPTRITTSSSSSTQWLLALLLCVLPPASSPIHAAPQQDPAPDPIIIGSKNFTENRLLAEIMAQLIESRTDLTVERRSNLAGTQIAFSALQSGDIDIYPEYTGTGWSILLKIDEKVSSPLRAYLGVAQGFRRQFDIRWLQPFGFSNGYEIAMDADHAKELGITRISDLRKHAATLRVGFTHEFLNREDGYPGLAETYGLEFPNVRGIEHGLAYEGLRTRRIDVIETYTTDGKLMRLNLCFLEDDKGFFPPYDCAPIIRQQTLERHPELEGVLDELAFTIDDRTMMQLNFRVEEEGGSFGAVARDFLVSKGLLQGTETTHAPKHEPGFFGILWSRRSQTLSLVGEHMGLTALAVLLAIAVALPLGIALTRRPIWVGPVLGTAGAIQTIPSLALLAFMIPIPFLGLGARSAVAALFLYALLPIVRNTYTGIKEVDADLLEAARGMGLTRGEILTRVELPLAIRTIMAGVRTSTVISVGVATLAAFIGAGGLGEPILTGLQLNDFNLILSGAIPAALLALGTDFLLGVLERILAPRGVD